MKHDQLIGDAAAARLERAADEIRVVADGGAAETVPTVRHRRQRRPAIGFRIKTFVFRERVVGRQLAAEHQDHAVIIGAGKAAARRRQRCRRRPFVGRRVVHFVQAGAVGRSFEAAADDMNFSIDRDDDQMVARRRQRRRFAPLARLRVENFVGRHHDAVEATAADDVNLAVHRSGADRAARPFHRRQHAPSVGFRIVFEGASAGALMHRADEAAEGVDFAGGHGDAEMIASLGQRRAGAPRIGRRVVFVVIRAGGSAHRAAERVQLAVECHCGDFGARRRQRRFYGPSPGQSAGRRLPVDRGD